jgi:hypothetical protein
MRAMRTNITKDKIILKNMRKYRSVISALNFYQCKSLELKYITAAREGGWGGRKDPNKTTVKNSGFLPSLFFIRLKHNRLKIMTI